MSPVSSPKSGAGKRSGAPRCTFEGSGFGEHSFRRGGVAQGVQIWRRRRLGGAPRPDLCSRAPESRPPNNPGKVVAGAQLLNYSCSRDLTAHLSACPSEFDPHHQQRPGFVRRRTSSTINNSRPHARLRWRRCRRRSCRACANASSTPSKISPGDQVPRGVLVFDILDPSSSDERIRSGGPEQRATIDHPAGSGPDMEPDETQSQTSAEIEFGKFVGECGPFRFDPDPLCSDRAARGGEQTHWPQVWGDVSHTLGRLEAKLMPRMRPWCSPFVVRLRPS